MSELEKLQARLKDLNITHEIKRKALEETEIDLKAIKLLITQTEEEAKKLKVTGEEF